jgi:hypothetical protein
MFERFTKAARATVIEAQTEARRLGHDRIGTGNVLLALTTSEGIAAEVLGDAGITHDSVELALAASEPDDDLGNDDAEALEALGIDLEEVKRTVEASFGKGALSRPFSRKGHLPFTKGAKKTLELALREALHLGHNYIGTEHILMGLLRNNTSSASAMLTEMGMDHDAIRKALLERLPKAS